MSNSPVAAASATYRKVVNDIAEVSGQEPTHSRYPSLDFEVALEGMSEAGKQKAIEWYVRGIKRGMAKATDLMAAKTIYVEDETVYAPKKIKVNLLTKMKGERWKTLKVVINSHEIGFKGD
jgi:hypothetical protein